MESKESTRHVILPESLEAQTVAGMSVGDTKAAHWQVMKVDSSRGCWLHPGLAVYDDPEGERALLITKTEEGYVVDATLVQHPAWEVESDFSLYQIPDEEWIPVARLIF